MSSKGKARARAQAKAQARASRTDRSHDQGRDLRDQGVQEATVSASSSASAESFGDASSSSEAVSASAPRPGMNRGNRRMLKRMIILALVNIAMAWAFMFILKSSTPPGGPGTGKASEKDATSDPKGRSEEDVQDR